MIKPDVWSKQTKFLNPSGIISLLTLKKLIKSDL